MRINLGHLIPASIVVAACASNVPSPGVVRHDGVALFAGLRSYQSPEEVKKQLGEERRWRVVFDQPWPSTDPRPRFSQLTIEVDALECGQPGTLSLTFINELLVSAGFTPDDMNACQQQLPGGMVFTETSTELGNTRTWLWRIGQPPFIGILDTRLQAEVSAWIRAYS